MSQIMIPPVELVSPSDLKVDGDNPNHMTDRQRKALAENMKRFGFIVPIITNKDGLIADGQQRWEVAQTLGLKEVPVIKLPIEDVDRRILRQVLNKLRGEHLIDLDAKEYLKVIEAGERETLQRLSAISDKEIQRAIIDLRSLPLGEEDFNFAEETNIQRGDIFQLDNHRLMCGDATEKKDVDLLLQDEKIDCVFTDPPYGAYKGDWSDSLRASYHPPTKFKLPIYQDIPVDKYNEFTEKWMRIIPFNDYNTIYVWINAACLRHLLNGAYQAAIDFKHTVIWMKQHFVLSSIDYRAQHEICLYGWKGKHKFYGTNKTSIIYYDRPFSSPLHATMKPIGLCSSLIQDGSLEGHIVYDPFGGSGTTLCSCEELQRKCRTLEIEPVFVQTIINRWEKRTGKKAELLESARNEP